MSNDEIRRLRTLLLGEDYADAARKLLGEDPPREKRLAVCPHPALTNLCRICEVANRADRHGTEEGSS